MKTLLTIICLIPLIGDGAIKYKAMTKHYCDCCKIETNELYVIPIYIHVKNENRLLGHCKVIDGKTYPVSGRTENTDLCIKCYNEFMFPLWEKLTLNL